MIRNRIFGIALAAAALGVACNDDDVTSVDPSAPILPPPSSMQFDLGFFQERIPGGDTYQHWTAAALTVSVLNTLVTTALTPPAAVLNLALDTTPSYLGDNAFMWIYTWTDGVEDVQVRLRGELVEADGPDRIDWALRVTNTQKGQDDALWFTGESSINGRGGQWTFFDIDAGNEIDPFVVVDWTVNDVDAIIDRTLSLEVMQGENTGDSLTYNVLTPNVNVQVHNAGEESTTEIEWDENTGSGFIDAPHYNGGDRGCWDNAQTDTSCPVDPA